MDHKQTLAMLEYNQSLEPKVQDVLAPVMGFFKDLSFGYTRYYHDESRIILETNTNWLMAHVEKGLYDQALSECFRHVISQNDNQYVSLITGEPTTPVHSLLFEHDMWNGLSFFVKSKSYVEAFHLESSRNNAEVLKLYVSHPDVFQNMVSFIRHKLIELKIEEAPKCPFPLALNNSNQEGFKQAESNETAHKNRELDAFSKEIGLKKVYLPQYDIFLPKQQAVCYSLLSKGFSSKEIGNRLGLSSRTVESYIAIIKEKLGVHYKNEIISNENSFSDQFYYC